MRSYVDHVLALLPFEPDVHARLGGPPCTYVGHPLIESVARLRPNAEEALRRERRPPLLLVLPGSRAGELARLLSIFGEAVGLVQARYGPLELVVPAVPQFADRIRAATAAWPVAPRIAVEPAEKQAAFRSARAALAKSGTVTLELALAGVPMVTAYKFSRFEQLFRSSVIKVPTIILANLVLGEELVPEFLDASCTARNLADALLPVLDDTPQRQRQVEAFSRLDGIMQIGRVKPSERAADIVIGLAKAAAMPPARP
jgi:lipid-A-disaccharide synthase